MAYKQKQKSKYIKTDAWRGYEQPAYAVLGSSDTGMWEDSPAPSDRVSSELKRFQSFLKDRGIGSQLKTTKSSNVFMVKRWIVVQPNFFKKAKQLASEFMKKDTVYVHEAD